MDKEEKKKKIEKGKQLVRQKQRVREMMCVVLFFVGVFFFRKFTILSSTGQTWFSLLGLIDKMRLRPTC